MKNYDWIVIGGGITGSALAYELVRKGFEVLLLEKQVDPNNATRYSYGGLAYWSGTDEFSHKLCQEGLNIHRNLSEELDGDTEFREIDLLLTINLEDDPKIVLDNYNKFSIKPQFLSIEQACQLESLLNPNAISGALKLPQGHINPQKTNEAYQQAFLRLGGELKIEEVIELITVKNVVEGVVTNGQKYYSKNTVVCAGALTRSLLKKAGITVDVYFTHAQLIMTPPVDIHLKTMVMPAVLKRLMVESEVSQYQWDNPSSELIADVMEPGAIQFRDGRICLGQISQICTNPQARIDQISSEKTIRKKVGELFPTLQNLPGTWHNCLVAFTPYSNSLVGKIEDCTGIYLFSGFTSTLIFAPPLAKYFAHWIAENSPQLPVISHQ
ncbi:FAD dependent oxidoreductase [Rippkaea orientalis PCC 8801]|uniref:FAD dependent oxidoreductase n=1 Tax=Rippkaea orientalis (strain PCC 8801 / RF-1) TaxID=41431 RepID=B7JY36_RIPO1|nr:FAD-binding oxidoreductase [Rippkaea orientalis]ACK66000.1 FAD dependent oxidoreductase [Rippkaea orientalis PCC 8801]